MPRAFLGGGNVAAAHFSCPAKAIVKVTLANGGTIEMPADEYEANKSAWDLPQPAPASSQGPAQ